MSFIEKKQKQNINTVGIELNRFHDKRYKSIKSVFNFVSCMSILFGQKMTLCVGRWGESISITVKMCTERTVTLNY